MRQRVIKKTVLGIVIWGVLIAARPAIAQETNESDGGYIDAAVLRNQIRLRLDAANNNPFPDRAEFFYPKCGCLTNAPAGVGPPLGETAVDHQEFEAYFEAVLRPRLSVFAEIPIRWIDPDVNANEAGLGDVRTGLKYALIEACNRRLTFQLRGYFPSGDGAEGLGTEHFSIEPGLLYQRDGGRGSVFSEFKAWIPLSPSQHQVNTGLGTNGDQLIDFSGTVVRYGVGFSYDLFQQPCHFTCSRCDCCQPSVGNRLSFVGEFVGWTIGGGLKSRVTDPTANGGIGENAGMGTVFDATGDTIVNAKIGLRWTRPRDSIYVGYGRALTGDFWYRDIVRAEYSMRF